MNVFIHTIYSITLTKNKTKILDKVNKKFNNEIHREKEKGNYIHKEKNIKIL